MTYPEIDPIIFSIGPLAVRWYGLMYVIGFIAAYFLVAYQAKLFKWDRLTAHLDNLNFALIIGVIVGGRLGYICFYNLSYYINNPSELLAIWQGGMSFHGGCIGVLTTGFLYSSFNGLNFWKGADLYVAAVPVGLFFGRIGNFINGELFGRTTNTAWGMIFPDGGPLPRHPSQLYEAFLEGIILFAILWAVKSKPWKPESNIIWPHGSILALFLICYGIFRSIVELFREPDPQIGLVLLNLSMGQILSFLMISAGIAIWLCRYSKNKKEYFLQKHQ